MPDVLPPLVPVAERQARQDADLDGIFFFLFARVLVAVLISAGRIDIRYKRSQLAVARNYEWRLHAAGKFGDRLDVLPVRVGDIQLHLAVTARKKRDAPVRQEPRRVLALRAADEQLRGRGPVRWDDPHIGVPLAGVERGCRALINDAAAVRRQLRIGDANGPNQIVDSHRPFGLRVKDNGGGTHGDCCARRENC